MGNCLDCASTNEDKTTALRLLMNLMTALDEWNKNRSEIFKQLIVIAEKLDRLTTGGKRSSADDGRSTDQSWFGFGSSAIDRLEIPALSGLSSVVSVAGDILDGFPDLERMESLIGESKTAAESLLRAVDEARAAIPTLTDLSGQLTAKDRTTFGILSTVISRLNECQASANTSTLVDKTSDAVSKVMHVYGVISGSDGWAITGIATVVNFVKSCLPDAGQRLQVEAAKIAKETEAMLTFGADLLELYNSVQKLRRFLACCGISL